VSAYRVESTPGEAKKLRRKAGDAQVTFAVTRADAMAFAAALLSGDQSCERATLVVQETSGALYHVGPLIAHPPLEPLPRDTTIAATGPEAAAALLAAAVSDYVDFWFAPTPGALLVYADNDGYATVFAHRQGPVSRAGERLQAAGLSEVTGYRWTP
jgi:hypothetical protein